MPNPTPEMSWLDRQVMKVVMGQVRHGLTVVAGMLIANGAIQRGQESQFVEMGAGILGWAIAAIWSAMQKKGTTNV